MEAHHFKPLSIWSARGRPQNPIMCHRPPPLSGPGLHFGCVFGTAGVSWQSVASLTFPGTLGSRLSHATLERSRSLFSHLFCSRRPLFSTFTRWTFSCLHSPHLQTTRHPTVNFGHDTLSIQTSILMNHLCILSQLKIPSRLVSSRLQNLKEKELSPNLGGDRQTDLCLFFPQRRSMR